jgi:hypothetical protein
MWSTITKWISALGQNEQFLGFVCHFGVAALLCEHTFHYDPIIPVLLFAIGGGLKEFYWDAKYETDPPQSFTDNLSDWIGWVSGALFGMGFAVGWW